MFMLEKPQPVQTSQPLVISPYTITISRASWGLNCRVDSENESNNDLDTSFGDVNAGKIKDNNVFSSISQLCNKKSRCDIVIDPRVLGEDPLPTCMYKELQIEYRCFSVDRLRKLKATEGIAIIDCDKQLGNP